MSEMAPTSLLTPEQISILRRYIADAAAFQHRVCVGDEDDRLKEIADTFDAYFALCRAVLGHDQVPVVSWETRRMISDRLRSITDASGGR